MPTRTFVDVTTVHKTRTKVVRSRALRVAIPRIVVSFLELQPGDGLKWEIDTVARRVTVEKTEGPRKGQ